MQSEKKGHILLLRDSYITEEKRAIKERSEDEDFN